MKQLFDNVSIKTSKMVTNSYSTSFSLGIKFLHKQFQDPIYSIYGFVRFADEIVDTFHDYNKKELLDEFKIETYRAIERRISLNPVLNSFQKVVNDFKIDHQLIDTFLKSMEMDLEKKEYTEEGYKEYILGSAEVVGLMCLRVFVKGNQKMYDDLTPYAMALGSAFQKINFLRDLHADYLGMGRVYFPNVELKELDPATKAALEEDIEVDFNKGLEGIKLLPKDSRFGVYVAYIYYRKLLNKIKSLHPERILEERISIPNSQKMALFASSYVRHSLNLL
ncbi:MAG: phytoene/squalene synthase family protein [Bacteroidetes bacterium]|nr:phytoene/squalene synthase family protein [Bacteroidota bacterium]